MPFEKSGHQEKQTVPEEELVRRAQQRDADAWTELYNGYVDRIYRYTLARVRNTMLAEDLTEQVFLRALNSISSFTWKGDPFAAWLFRIAHNLIIDFHRKPSSKEQSLPEWDLPTSGADPVEMAETNITMEMVLQEVDKLTPGQRQAIELRFIADLSIEETARIMGKNPGAVKALQHSALASLRRLLSKRGNDE
ncbi:MAG: sigma-70 family RNA polymerase sigma factor [Chloroflexi bacterium]|nr:sigma-70 family RNA polymerase sigma factor [Chloroflexota bacterium]